MAKRNWLEASLSSRYSGESNLQWFVRVYEEELRKAVEAHPEEYMLPTGGVDELVRRMKKSIVARTFYKDSVSFRNTCKRLGLSHTYKAIREFIGNDTYLLEAGVKFPENVVTERMFVHIKEDVVVAGGSLEAGQYREELYRLKGKWCEVDPQYLYEDQYNLVLPLRVMDEHIDGVHNDARIGVYKCGHCGHQGKEAAACPNCGRTHYDSTTIGGSLSKTKCYRPLLTVKR